MAAPAQKQEENMKQAECIIDGMCERDLADEDVQVSTAIGVTLGDKKGCSSFWNSATYDMLSHVEAAVELDKKCT